MIIGALVPSVQKVGTWGMLPVLVLAGISGIFFPMQELWGWVQVIAQIFPMYWLGLGMRSAFLPDSAAAMEIAGSWRTRRPCSCSRRGRSSAWCSPRSSCAGCRAGNRAPRSRPPGTPRCNGSAEPRA